MNGRGTRTPTCTSTTPPPRLAFLAPGGHVRLGINPKVLDDHGHGVGRVGLARGIFCEDTRGFTSPRIHRHRTGAHLANREHDVQDRDDEDDQDAQEFDAGVPALTHGPSTRARPCTVSQRGPNPPTRGRRVRTVTTRMSTPASL